MNKNTARQSALGFASLGYGVFPLHGVTKRGDRLACTCGDSTCNNQGKHPFARLAPHGLKDATTDVAKVRGWPHTWLNYGLATDPFIVVDVDPRHGGDKSWSALYRQTTRALPYTWQVNTGGSGQHIIFRNTADIKCGTLAKGVDIKAIGGYIVGPGCAHISGKNYQWAPACSPSDAPLADPPLWLLDEIRNKQPVEGERKPPEFWDELIENGFCNGSRNNDFTRLTGHLIGCSVDPSIAWHAIRCINLCAPDVLPEGELSGIFNRVMDLEIKKRGL